MRKQTVTPEQIIESTIELVATNGLENISVRKIADHCDISQGSIFNYFENKNDLLVKCLYYIDKAIDAEFQSLPLHTLSLKKVIRLLWFQYFDYLVAHPYYAKYYRQFRHSSYYTPEVIAGQDSSFSFFVNYLKIFKLPVQSDLDVIWTYIIETTLNFAVRVADGQFPNTEKGKEKYFSLVVFGMEGIFKNAKKWDRD